MSHWHRMGHSKYMAMVATRTEVEPENLPPTERATYYHALRVHLQVAQWKHLDLICLNSLDWGWTLQNNFVVRMGYSKWFVANVKPPPNILAAHSSAHVVKID